MHKNCLIPKIDKELEANGNWKVVAGIEGKTTELSFNVEVAAKGMQMFTISTIQLKLEYYPNNTSMTAPLIYCSVCQLLHTFKIIFNLVCYF